MLVPALARKYPQITGNYPRTTPMFSNHRAFIDIQKATFLHSVPPLLHVQVSEGRGGSLLACPERGRPGLFDPTAIRTQSHITCTAICNKEQQYSLSAKYKPLCLICCFRTLFLTAWASVLYAQKLSLPRGRKGVLLAVFGWGAPLVPKQHCS
eukprot:94843-Pelagomonas_calceolata.AAC.2